VLRFLLTVAPPRVLTKVRVDPAGAILRVVKQQTDQTAPVTTRHPGMVQATRKAMKPGPPYSSPPRSRNTLGTAIATWERLQATWRRVRAQAVFSGDVDLSNRAEAKLLECAVELLRLQAMWAYFDGIPHRRDTPPQKR
jgi:hypothetical protein